jgi:phenylacetate-CoA ligase
MTLEESMNNRLYFQPELETLPVEKLRELQLERFVSVLQRAFRKSPYYRSLYKKAGIKPKDITSLDDVRELPVIDREMLQSSYPMSHLCTEPQRLRELHSANGVRRRAPILVAATQQDIDYWADLNARDLWMVGLRPGNVLLNAFPLAMTTQGFAFHYGALKLGMVSVPAGNLPMERLADLMIDVDATGLCGIPSQALKLSRYVERRKIDLKGRSSCRVALLGEEPWSWATRERIEETLGLKAYDHYGMSELLGPGVGCECEVRDRRFGMHTWADAFLCECLDPRTGEAMDEEEEGELVWTSLVWEGTPLIRYRSRDLSAITWRPCECGRTHPRLAPIKGATDDAVTLEGIIVYPSQVEECLLAFEEAGSKCRIVVDRDRRGGDYFSLRVELKDKAYLNDEQLSQGLARKMKETIRQRTGLSPRDVELVQPGGLRKTEGTEEKTALVRVEDRRPKD